MNDWANTPDAPLNPPDPLSPNTCTDDCDECQVSYPCGREPLRVNEDADEPSPDIEAWTRGYQQGYLAAMAGWKL